MNKSVFLLNVLLLGILFVSLGSALDATKIVINSQNWEDVYSSMLYSTLTGSQGYFLTSTEHGPILLNGIPLSEEIGIVTSDEDPFVFGYRGIVDSRGYESVEELVVDSANLELIEEPELENIENFIVVGNSYGYSAVAVTPYATRINAWVFLADRVNIAEIENILDGREVDRLIIYGYVEREVSNALQRFNPEVIDSGNRFEDNIEIVEMFKEEVGEVAQVSLTNGEFVESELMTGTHAILFTGRDNVPPQIADYIKESEITVGVLIGNELINAATNIRRSTGISVMVKFAQGARQRVAGVSAVEGLDLFYLPMPVVNLGIHSIKYNRASSKVEVTYHSTSNVPIYFKGTLTARSSDDSITTGDLDPIFIAPNDYKTVVYPDIRLEGNDLTAELVTLFGEIPTSLDYRLSAEVEMGIINILDKCDVEPTYIKYNIQRESFTIGVKNHGEVDCYVDIELTDLRINNRAQTIGTDGSNIIPAGKKGRIEIDQRMTEEDLKDNDYIDLVAYYGEREDALVNTYKKRFELNIDRYTAVTYLIIVLIILLILLLLWFFILKRRRKEDDW